MSKDERCGDEARLRAHKGAQGRAYWLEQAERSIRMSRDPHLGVPSAVVLRWLTDLAALDGPRICGVISASGPNGEPLACGYAPGHEERHSWASLPSDFGSQNIGRAAMGEERA